MVETFTEERLRILKTETDNLKVRVGKLETQLKTLLTKLESLDENMADLFKWR